jgi:hypothetical protein
MAALQRTESEVEAEFEVVDSTVMDEPLLAAIQGDDLATVESAPLDCLLKPTTAKTYALHEACEHGSMRVVKFLVEQAGCDVNARDAQQWTPLHYAAAFDEGPADDLVNFLLSHGADAALEDEDGDTPLDCCDDACDAQALLLASASDFGDYETWARAVARDATFGAYVQRARPKYVRDALRHELCLLARQAAPQPAASPEAFLLGSHGGHAVFAHLLPYLA